jgi:hypothetical protein
MTNVRLSRLWKTCKVLLFAWHYRKPIIATIDEIDQIQSLFTSLKECGDPQKAQATVLAILQLRPLRLLAAATPMQIDDVWLMRMQAFVEDFEIFHTAWKILHGDWNITIPPSYRIPFLQRIKHVLPFAAGEDRLILTDTMAEVESENDVEGIVEIVGLIQLLMTIVPKIMSVIQRNNL